MFLRRVDIATYEVGDYLVERVGGNWILRHGPSGQVIQMFPPGMTFGMLSEIIAKDQAFRASDQ